LTAEIRRLVRPGTVRPASGRELRVVQAVMADWLDGIRAT
jgi:hypothetical protein